MLFVKLSVLDVVIGLSLAMTAGGIVAVVVRLLG